MTGKGTRRSMNLQRARAGKRTGRAVVSGMGATHPSGVLHPSGGDTGQTQCGTATQEEREREVHQENPEEGQPYPAALHTLHL